jgi:hypothetical protein
LSREWKESWFYRFATSNPAADQREQVSSCGRCNAESGGTSFYWGYIQLELSQFFFGSWGKQWWLTRRRSPSGLQGWCYECLGPRVPEQNQQWGSDLLVSAAPHEQKESWQALQLRWPIWAFQLLPCSWVSVRLRARGPGLQGRTSCWEKPATRTNWGWTGIRCGDSQVRWLHQPATANWAAEVPSQGLYHSEPAASSEADTRYTSFGDMSGHLWHAWWHHFKCPSGQK